MYLEDVYWAWHKEGEEWDVFRRLFRHARFKKGSTTTVQNSYQPTKGEIELAQASADYAKKVAPNAYYLNDVARKLLQDSLGTVQVDYNRMNNEAQVRLASAIGSMGALVGKNDAATETANAALGRLSQGALPQAYQQNMENSIRSTLENTMGKTIAGLGSRGVLNSSVTAGAMGDISKSAADAVARQYQQNIAQQANLHQQQWSNAQANSSQNSGLLSNLANMAGSPIAMAAAAQEAAQQPAFRAWNASMGLNGATTSALAGIAGKGTSTQTTHQSGGSFLGGLLGGVLGGAANSFGAGLFCFPRGTQIKMADGSKKSIEEIETGDKVMAWCEKGEEEAEVLRTMQPHHAEVYSLICSDGQTKATLSQPFMTEDGTFLTLDQIAIKQRLKNVGSVYAIHLIGERWVYDMEVSGPNTYIADGFIAKGGDGSIWKE